jgi:putative sigma-54 modulation protein
MYASIDAAAHSLNRKLRTYKERRIDGWHGGGHMGDDLAAALELAESASDEEETVSSEMFFDDVKDNDKSSAQTVTKVKSFQLDKPISLDEAIFALDYVDHDFYVFRNEATNEVNVVYKRHTGGVGLVEP